MRLDEGELVRWGRRVGESIAESTAGPMFVGLSGPLGAGKSVLARAIGEGAGVVGPMPSPTYTLVQGYDASGGRRLMHLDLYRIESPDEVWELGWEDLLDEGQIAVVEWPERAGPLLPLDRWLIALTPASDRPDLRDVELTRHGSPPELPTFQLPVKRR
jgi:tRNA threonylcarbamoyladenosine biosynthesis protein TsaE